MNFVINAAELRRALAEIEAAEKNGFMYCLAVLRLESAGVMLSDCRLRYSDMIEMAHPTDGRFDWGRFQSVSKYNRFVDGRLVPIKDDTAVGGQSKAARKSLRQRRKAKS